MTKITIHPAWTFTNELGDRVDPHLFSLLGAVRDTGKLTLAATRIKLSYRHAWDLLHRWSTFFGGPLVAMQRGKGAQLTPLGTTLLWAEQRTEASLFPQLENIASELNIEIGRALKASQSIIRIHASHGYAIEKLPGLMRQHGHATVDLQYMGSIAALESLSRSRCDLAGFHVPIGKLAKSLWQHYAKWIRPRQQKIIRLVLRTQGLIVPKGNPKNIQSIGDLARPGLRFVNRQATSGTRILLDGLVNAQAIDARQIQGYESGEFTHAAVAAFVASGMAEVGFGVEPAARQFKLDFVPIIKERYMLACRTGTLERASIQELVALLKGNEFSQIIARLPGYAPDAPGTVESIRQAIP
ncbi:MAG TPA: substrate-binding domain-containing protein [Casimicrobiaceae bacterium]|nr:substrate-binding domain-containing protein [Casimicrobiaceae bacterium]